MFKSIKVVTGLVSVLVLFAVLQLGTGGLFFKAVHSDKQNFELSQQMRILQQSMGNSWVSLVQARNTLNRAGIRYLQDVSKSGAGTSATDLMTQAKADLAAADKSLAVFNATLTEDGKKAEDVQTLLANYKQFHTALSELIVMMETGRFDDFVAQPTQSYQEQFQQAYNHWLEVVNQLTAQGIKTNEDAYHQTIWLLLGVLLVSAAVIALAWSGIRKLLLLPLNSNIEHIRHIDRKSVV